MESFEGWTRNFGELSKAHSHICWCNTNSHGYKYMHIPWSNIFILIISPPWTHPSWNRSHTGDMNPFPCSHCLVLRQFVQMNFWVLSTWAKAVQSIQVPIKYLDLQDNVEKFRIESRPILDPHSIISFLFNQGKMHIPRHHVEKYWRHHAEHGEQWAQTVDNHQMIPVGIFGDAAWLRTEFGATNYAGIFFNIVLFKPKSVRSSRFLLFCIAEDELWSHFTIDTVLRRITWSLNSLYDGVHPSLDPWGKELPERLKDLAGQSITDSGLRFCTTEVRGDWSWHKKIWRFERTSWNAIRVCHWCRALSDGNWNDVYWNLSDTSNWHNKLFTLDEFMEERMLRSGICNTAEIQSSFFQVQCFPSIQFWTPKKIWLTLTYIPFAWVMFWNWGPLLGLRNFHPTVIRWCLMHVCHLGVLFTINGSALTPGSYQTVVDCNLCLLL